MKERLFLKFLASYLIFGLLSFLLIATLGNRVLTQAARNQTIHEMHDMAVNLAASYPEAASDAAEEEEEFLALYFDTCAEISGFEIWILNTKGHLLYRSSSAVRTALHQDTGFDPTDGTGGYYMTGNFYGYMPEDTITVFAPLTGYYTTNGYVLLHLTTSALSSQINSNLNTAYLTMMLVFTLSLFFLLVFRLLVNRPLAKIITAARQYAVGNLNYQTAVHTNDEMEDLYDTLLDMAVRLNSTAEDQHKFIANVSHDFRSPLTSIKGYLVAMEDGTIPQELYPKYIKIVLDETERLSKLTERLLTLNGFDTKGTYLNWEKYELHSDLKKILATFEGRCQEKHITFDFTYSSRQLYVYADPDKIQQVLYNLIDNAIKFSPQNSVISIETLIRGEKAVVSIKDHGCGIAKENLNRIWDRFYKTDASRGRDRKGTGLGLSIVKEIITAHKEHIDVISTVGVGTQFVFTLPLYHDPSL